MPDAPTPPFDPTTEQYRSTVDHALMTTRGVRKRLDFERDVDDQVILDCIDVAEQAPTGGNTGSRRWMIIRDPETKSRMAELYLSAGVDWVIKTAEKLEGTGHQNEALMLGAKHLGENIARTPALVIPTIMGVHDGSGRPGLFDSVIQSAWSFMVALRARGLGTVWTTMYLNERDAVAELLDLPDGVTQICLFPVAYTIGTDFKATTRRYPAREIAYFDRYGRTLAAESNDAGIARKTMAEGPGVIVETDVKAKPEVLWPLITDIELPAQFSDEFQGATWDGGSAPAVGATFTGRNRIADAGFEWETVSHVVACDEPRTFAWNVMDVEASAARWRFSIERVPGGSRLRFAVRLGPGPSGLTMAIEREPDREAELIAGRQDTLRRNMQRTIDGIRELAESQTAQARSDFPGLR